MNRLSPGRTAALGLGLSFVSAALWYASRCGLRAHVQLVSDVWQLRRGKLMADENQRLERVIHTALEQDFTVHDITLALRAFDSPPTSGKNLTGHADHLIITVDGGSANPFRRRRQLEYLLGQALAGLTGDVVTITVDHIPPLPK